MRRLILLVLGLLWVLGAPVAVAAEASESLIERQFGRLALYWSDSTTVTSERRDGTIEITTSRPFPSDLEPAVERLSPVLTDWAIDDGRTRLDLVPAPGKDIEVLPLDDRSLLIALGPSTLATLGLRTGQHEAFRRAVIEPVSRTSTSVAREHGRVIVGLPGSLSTTDLERLAALPGVAAARMAGAQLVVDLADGAGTRDLFVEPDKQVLDIYPTGLSDDAPLASADPQPSPAPVAAPADSLVTEARLETAHSLTEPESMEAETISASPADESTSELPVTTVDQPHEPVPADSAPAAAWPHFSELAIDSVAGADGIVELRFGWPNVIPAAVFTRGAQLWVAFAAKSDKIAVDTAAFSRSAGRFVNAIRQEPHPEATVLRLSLSKQPAIEVDRDGNDWRVILSSGAAPPSKDKSTTIEPSNGGILLPHVERAVSITDPVVGDRLGIGFAAPVGAITHVPARYIGARFLAAEQGAAWEQLIATSKTGKPAARGLWLGPTDGVVTGPYDHNTPHTIATTAASETEAFVETDAPSPREPMVDEPVDDAPTESAASETDRSHQIGSGEMTSEPRLPETAPDAASDESPPGDDHANLPVMEADLKTGAVTPSPLGLARFRSLPQSGFWEQKGALETAINRADAGGRLPLRQDLVRLHLAHGLGREAKAQLDAMQPQRQRSGLPEAAISADLALQGVANFLIGQLDEALVQLGDARLAADSETALWHAATLAELERWDDASYEWQRGQSLLDAYPPETRAVLGERGIMLLLQTGRIDDAFALIDGLRSQHLSTAAGERIDQLEATALARDGATEEAEAIWSRLVQEGRPESRTTALRSLIEQDLAAGRITSAEALDRLDADSVHWRGQRDEFRLWQQLAKLQQDNGQLETAMQTLHAALVREPPVTASKAITTDMAKLLDLLFAEFETGARDATSMLQLYRQFSELVAAGAEGDRQVLLLSEALIGLDLSGPAIELLRSQLQRSTARNASRARLGLALARSLAGAANRQGAIAALLDTTPVEQIEPSLSDARRQLLSDLGRPDNGAESAENRTPVAATLASARAALDRAAADPAAWREVVEATLGLEMLLPASGTLDRRASEIVLIAATAARQLGELALVEQLSQRYSERLPFADDAAILQMLASTGDLSGAAVDVPADAAVYIQRLRQALAAMPAL